MKLAGITIETNHLYDFISFMTEVMDLEIMTLSQESVKLTLEGAWLEIVLITGTVVLPSDIVMTLAPEEFDKLLQKVDFYFFRKKDDSFKISSHDPNEITLADPDHRLWRLQRLSPSLL